MTTNFLSSKSIGSIILGNNASNNNQPQMAYTQVGVGSTTNYGTIGFGTTTPSTTLCWTAGGSVGIGTTAPYSQLTVYGTSGPTLGIGSVGSWNNMAVSYNIVGAGSTNNYALFQINNVSSNYQLVLSANGNIGIGTTQPSNLLTITQLGSAYTKPLIVVDAGIPGNSSTGAPRGIGQPLIGIGNTSFTSGGVSGDYYGIGFGFGGASGGSNYYPAEIGLYVTSSSGNEQGDIVFSARNSTSNIVASERMRITSAGYVGIGTNAPAYTLDVNGSARVSGGLQVNGYSIPQACYIANCNFGALGSYTFSINGNYIAWATIPVQTFSLYGGTNILPNAVNTNSSFTLPYIGIWRIELIYQISIISGSSNNAGTSLLIATNFVANNANPQLAIAVTTSSTNTIISPVHIINNTSTSIPYYLGFYVGTGSTWTATMISFIATLIRAP